MIRYGYACKTIGVPGTEQRGLTLAGASPGKLLEVSRHNLAALAAAIGYCASQGIGLFRISSDIIPFGSHCGVTFDWKKACRDELRAVTQAIARSGIRVSMHPGQYTVLNSARDDVVRAAVADVIFHAEFLDAVEAAPSACIVLHVGGVYNERAQAMQRFVRVCRDLPAFARDRLALENDERNFAIDEVLQLCHKLGLRALFDVFHHVLLPPARGPEDMVLWLDRCAETWAAPVRQKIHYSQQQAGSRAGVHSQTIAVQPFMSLHEALGTRELDIMLEVKDKNLSAVKSANLTMSSLPARRLTDEWARYKYLVLERSQRIYRDMRACIKAEKPDPKLFYTLLESALAREVTPGEALNAAQHVWGYVDTLAEPVEKKRVLADLDALHASTAPLARLKRKLFALAHKHRISYLLQSLYFYL